MLGFLASHFLLSGLLGAMGLGGGGALAMFLAPIATERALNAAWSFLCHRSFWQLVCMALACFAVVQHFTIAHERKNAAAYLSQRDNYKRQLDAADAEARKAQAATIQIAKELKERTDEDNRRIAGDAQSLRVSGPGKAVCRPVAPSAGGHEQSAPIADAAGPPLPPADGADVSWGWLTVRAGEHDELLTEVKAWHEWYARVVAAWPKSKSN